MTATTAATATARLEPLSTDRGARIRVGHLIHSMAYGGIETALLNWVVSMNPARFEVHLFCFANPGGTEDAFVETAARRGLTVHRIPWSRRKPVFRAARAMAALACDMRLDILHCHNCYADVVGLAAARLAGVRTVTTVYVWHAFDWKRSVIQWIDLRVIRHFHQVTAHCEDARRGTVARGIPADRVTLLTCGFAHDAVSLPPEERRRRRAALGVGDDEIVLVNVARFWPEKAHDVLLDGFKAAHQRCPQLRLWLVGIGPEEGRIRAAVSALGLDRSVTFLGFEPKLADLLAIVDIQVHPSDIEGVSLAVCAGMAAGLPIVATRVGGLPEVLHHGRSALLVEPRQPLALAESVLTLVDQPDLARRLGAAARRFIEDEYSLTAATRRVEATYEAVMAR